MEFIGCIVLDGEKKIEAVRWYLTEEPIKIWNIDLNLAASFKVAEDHEGVGL